MNRIKLLRMENGIKQADLAKYINVAPNTLSQWETDYTEPGFENLKKIAAYFNTTTDYILGLSDDPKSPVKKEKAPSAETEREKDLKYLFKKIDELSDDDVKKAEEYLDFLLHRQNEGGNKK